MMSIIDKIKETGKLISDRYREHQEFLRRREHLLKDLTMPQLKKLADDYDIDIHFNEMYDEEPRRDDYICSIAESKLPTEKIEEYMKKIKRKEEIELTDPKSEKYITTTFFHEKVTMNQTSIGGNVNVIQNIFNDFSLAIFNSQLDLEIRKEALQKIEDLKKEMSKPIKDKSLIDKICRWFTENKTELATIAVPFISKILSNL